MLHFIRELARYGTLSIEASDKQWRIGILVRLPADVQTGFVRVYGSTLYSSLKALIPLAIEENKRLWKVQRTPKQ